MSVRTTSHTNWQNLCVLVVDDEEFSLNFAAKILSALGVGDIRSASNAQGALGIMEASDDAIDVLIADIEMPEMNGYQLIRRIRLGAVPRFKDIPVILLTGHFNDRHTQNARAHRVNGYVVKPPTVDVMRVEIERALAGE